MASPIAPKRYALLVGVDVYLTNGSRKDENGNMVALHNLRGCVNDVHMIRDFLRDRFQLHNPTVLTSTASSIDVNTPQERENQLPTFQNIKKNFDSIYEQTREGDLFFFHFSGHGACLTRISESPVGRSTDPSLLPADYCCGEPALRGWQLNQWLQRLNKKKVRVVVILDSCYSGGAWRYDGLFRTPEDWNPPLNLDIDEAAVQELTQPSNRDVELSVSWDINPEGFTLMAACKSDQKAAETKGTGTRNGAFTSELLASFNHLNSMATPTYRAIRDHIVPRLKSQTPQVFGRDRLAFFGSHEPFSATPVLVQLKENDWTLPIGKVQGVKTKAQFITYPPTTEVIFSVSNVTEHESTAQIWQGPAEGLPQRFCVIPHKWSTTETLNVSVDLNLGRRFQKQLRSGLRERIVGDVIVDGPAGLDESGALEVAGFQLKAGENGGVNIFGPASLLGYKGPVRGLKFRRENNDKQVAESAIALTHLLRFGQILDLRDETFLDPAPFQLTLQTEGVPQQGPFPSNQMFTYTFRNKAGEDLYLALINLGPGFHIQQVVPPNDSSITVRDGDTYTTRFRLAVPNELERYNTNSQSHRDIIRTVVTKGKQISLKSLELPDIWNADQMLSHQRNGNGRDFVQETQFSWWIQDKEVFTVLKK